MTTMTLKEWENYRDTLSALSQTAANEFRDAVFSNSGYFKGVGLGMINRDELIDYAYALATKYGEGASALSAQMFDEVAKRSGLITSAIPAETANYSEVAKAVNGSLKQSKTGKLLEQVVYRLVKQASADTVSQNAIRYGAEWAWIPHGDTCVFCLTLASRGWTQASENMLKNGHAEHIHANCDCQFAVRFNSNDVVDGYDPESYLELYNSASGKDTNEKINNLRREQYNLNKDKLNAQRRATYKANKELEQ